MAKSKKQKAPKMCFDKLLPNKLNKPHQMRVTGSGTLEAIAATAEKLWPNGTTKKIADDDDSGVGRNPRIEAVLYPGKYFALVRHFDTIGGIGNYTIQVVAR